MTQKDVSMTSGGKMYDTGDLFGLGAQNASP